MPHPPNSSPSSAALNFTKCREHSPPSSVNRASGAQGSLWGPARALLLDPSHQAQVCGSQHLFLAKTEDQYVSYCSPSSTPTGNVLTLDAIACQMQENSKKAVHRPIPSKHFPVIYDQLLKSVISNDLISNAGIKIPKISQRVALRNQK